MKTEIQLTGFPTLEIAQKNISPVYKTIVKDISKDTYFIFCGCVERAQSMYPSMFYEVIGSYENIGGVLFMTNKPKN